LFLRVKAVMDFLDIIADWWVQDDTRVKSSRAKFTGTKKNSRLTLAEIEVWRPAENLNSAFALEPMPIKERSFVLPAFVDFSSSVLAGAFDTVVCPSGSSFRF